MSHATPLESVKTDVVLSIAHVISPSVVVVLPVLGQHFPRSTQTTWLSVVVVTFVVPGTHVGSVPPECASLLTDRHWKQ